MNGMLRTNGATIHYEVHGTGPVLLISQSGEGDADRTTDLVRHLTGDHTVITYDRRGLSRSRLDDSGGGATMADHVDDVHRLLAAVTDRPAYMLGCSFGAAIGLHLAVEHPGQLHTLIAHEPVTPGLLPASERARHVRELEELQDLYRERGLADAFVKIAETLGIDPVAQDTEPGLTPHPLNDRRRAGFDFFIRNDFTAIARDTLDVVALGNTPVRVVPAFGRTTPRHVFDYRCAQELAALLGVEAREFPGGHNGSTTHPRAYATRIRELLACSGDDALDVG